MNKLLVVTLLACLCVFPLEALSAEQGLSFGYGFGVYNHKHTSRLEDGSRYEFFQGMYTYECPVAQRVSLLVEPYAAYVSQPNDGVDVGFTASGRVYFVKTDTLRAYFSVGGGMAYTSVKFQEQGTHRLFVAQGSLGLIYKSFFLENRFRHYSNGNTTGPNHSVNANIVSVGMYF